MNSLVPGGGIGIRHPLLIAGMEQVTTGSKSVERYPQTWLCAHERIAPIEWDARPEVTSAEEPYRIRPCR